MVNPIRRQQYEALIAESGWDVLVLYGHAWRKDYFRSLVNFSFFGPHAAATLTRGGDLEILLSHIWDFESLAPVVDAPLEADPDFAAALERRLGVHRGGTIAVAGLELMETRFADALARATGKPPRAATRKIETLRQVKTPDEIQQVRKAARLADIGYRHFVEAAEPGITEYELIAEVEGFLKSEGAEDNFMLIGSGGAEVFGMHPPTDRRLAAGDSVTTELSPQVGGYFAQICRTLVLGEPSPEQTRAFAIFSEAQQAAQAFLRPGVNISDLARVQNDVFRREGYGEYTTPRYTRVRGHNLGLHPDENPYVLEDVDCVVPEGMVLIAHPNTYLPLSGYMVFGDTLLVTTDGCESLNGTEKKLFSRPVAGGAA